MTVRERQLVAVKAGDHAVVDVSSAYSLPRFQAVRVDKVTEKTFAYSNATGQAIPAARGRIVFAGTEVDCDSLAAILRESVAQEWKAQLDLREAGKETRQRLIDQANRSAKK